MSFRLSRMLVLAGIVFATPVAWSFNPLGALTGGGSATTEAGVPKIKADSGQAFKGAQKVIIGGFKVTFIDFSHASAQAGKGFLGGSGFGGKSSARVRLAGIDDADRQRLTDAAYKSFVQTLKDNGFEVLNYALLAQQQGYADVPSYATPYRDTPFGADKELSMFQPSDFDQLRFFLRDSTAGVSIPFSTKSLDALASELGEKQGIHTLAVNYIIDFASTEQYEGRSTSNVAVSDIMSLAPGSSVAVIGGWSSTFNHKDGRLHIEQPMVSTAEFGSVSDVTPDVNKTVETAVNIVSALGGIGTNISRHYTVMADPSKYHAVSAKLLDDANAMFVQEMVSLR